MFTELTAIERTAYPRFKRILLAKNLEEIVPQNTCSHILRSFEATTFATRHDSMPMRACNMLL